MAPSVKSNHSINQMDTFKAYLETPLLNGKAKIEMLPLVRTTKYYWIGQDIGLALGAICGSPVVNLLLSDPARSSNKSSPRWTEIDNHLLIILVGPKGQGS